MNEQTIYEELIPYTMLGTQEWFAKIITYPLDENNQIQSHSQEGMCVAEETAKYLTSGPTLKPHERIQIYNQQYWWRLLNALQVSFPLVTRLCGFHFFNEQIGIPFLLAHPPSHWSIALIGEKLPLWISESYQHPDQALIYHSACLDWAFSEGYTILEAPPLDLADVSQRDPEAILNLTYYLQPYIYLFQWDYDLMDFRNAFLLHEVNYWTEHPFPKLKKRKDFYIALFRNKKNGISFRKISRPEYLLLNQFKEGATLSAACEFIEKQDEKIYKQTLKHMQKWLQEWACAGWLTESR
jgi:predicted Zn-ribbon and HTH transcriptional regulator